MAASASCVVLAHAKINLSLRVLAREASGFHQIETLFCLLELADEIRLEAVGDEVRLTIAAPPDAPGPPPDLGPVEQNLAVRAARSFLHRTGVARGVDIRLTKRIPAGAGLGGGSSDAAAVLVGLNRLHDEPLDPTALLEMAARLGSDVPFFCARTPLAFAWGRGTRLAPLPPLPARPVLLAAGPVRLDTAAIYRALAARRDRNFTAPAARVGLMDLDWRHLADTAVNDFEEVVFAMHPRLAEVRTALLEHGARFARMTGTGSVMFGVFDEAGDAAEAARRLANWLPGFRFIETRTAAP